MLCADPKEIPPERIVGADGSPLQPHNDHSTQSIESLACAGRSMSQVQPLRSAGSEQPQQSEVEQPATPGLLRDSAESAVRRARPSDSGPEALARHSGVGQHSSSLDSEIQPSEAADNGRDRRHEHRRGHSHGRPAYHWPNATQEQQSTRAERWLSDAAERAPRARAAHNPQFSIDSQDRKGAPPRLPQE